MQQKIKDESPYAPSTDLCSITLSPEVSYCRLVGNEETHSAERRQLWVMSCRWGICFTLLPGEDSENIAWEDWKNVRARVYRGVLWRAGPLTWHGHCTHEFKEAVDVDVDTSLQQDDVWERENRLLRSYPRTEKIWNIINHW